MDAIETIAVPVGELELDPVPVSELLDPLVAPADEPVVIATPIRAATDCLVRLSKQKTLSEEELALFYLQLQSLLSKFHTYAKAFPNSNISHFRVFDASREQCDTAYWRMDNKTLNVALSFLQAIEFDLLGVEAVVGHETAHSSFTTSWLQPKQLQGIRSLLLNHLEDWRLNTFLVRQFPHLREGFDVVYEAAFRSNARKFEVTENKPQFILWLWHEISRHSFYPNFETQVDFILRNAVFTEEQKVLLEKLRPHILGFQACQPDFYSRTLIRSQSKEAMAHALRIFEILEEERVLPATLTAAQLLKAINDLLEERKRSSPPPKAPTAEPKDSSPKPEEKEGQPAQAPTSENPDQTAGEEESAQEQKGDSESSPTGEVDDDAADNPASKSGQGSNQNPSHSADEAGESEGSGENKTGASDSKSGEAGKQEDKGSAGKDGGAEAQPGEGESSQAENGTKGSPGETSDSSDSKSGQVGEQGAKQDSADSAGEGDGADAQPSDGESSSDGEGEGETGNSGTTSDSSNSQSGQAGDQGLEQNPAAAASKSQQGNGQPGDAQGGKPGEGASGSEGAASSSPSGGAGAGDPAGGQPGEAGSEGASSGKPSPSGQPGNAAAPDRGGSGLGEPGKASTPEGKKPGPGPGAKPATPEEQAAKDDLNQLSTEELEALRDGIEKLVAAGTGKPTDAEEEDAAELRKILREAQAREAEKGCAEKPDPFAVDVQVTEVADSGTDTRYGEFAGYVDPVEEKYYTDYIQRWGRTVGRLVRLFANAKAEATEEQGHKLRARAIGHRLRIRAVARRLANPSYSDSKIFNAREGDLTRGHSVVNFQDVLVGIDSSGSMCSSIGIAQTMAGLIYLALQRAKSRCAIASTVHDRPYLICKGNKLERPEPVIRRLGNLVGSGDVDMANGSIQVLHGLQRPGSNPKLSRLVIFSDCCAIQRDMVEVSQTAAKIGYPVCVMAITSGDYAQDARRYMPNASFIQMRGTLTESAVLHGMQVFAKWMADPETFYRQIQRTQGVHKVEN